MLSADELSKLPAGTTVTMMSMVIPPKPPVSQPLLLPPPAPLNLPNTSAFSCSSPEFIDLDRVNLTASSECGSSRLAEEDERLKERERTLAERERVLAMREAVQGQSA